MSPSSCPTVPVFWYAMLMPLAGRPMFSVTLASWLGGMTRRTALATSPNNFAVCSTRRPPWPRMCSRISPESTLGKEVATEERREAEGEHDAGEECHD